MEGNKTTDMSPRPSASVHEDNVFFKQMLDYIPVKFYFNKNAHELLTKKDEDEESITEDQLVEETPKGKPQKKKKHQKVTLDPAEIKEKKKARFDPSIPQTVTEVQQKLLETEHAEASDASETKPKKKKKKKNKGEDIDDVSSIRSSTDSLEDLRERIQARINELRGKRKALGSDDAIEKKRMKRRVSKMELKLKKKMDKKNKVKGQVPKEGMVNGGPKVNPKSPSKPIFNKEGKMVFSKFDFTESGESKKKTDLPTGKDYKRLLDQVTKKKEKLNEVKKTDKEKAKEMQQDDAWKSALAKAEGIKIKDNPELLKRALKRKESKKKKSEKVWGEKKEALDVKMKEKQDKRKKNLQQRKKGKIDKKLKRLKKKGHIIPGF